MNSWSALIEQESRKPYYRNLQAFLEDDYEKAIVYPEKKALFTALDWTPFKDVRVVILGQDPYHGPNQAHGLSFSVLPGNKVPASLVNIYKELNADLGVSPATHGYLEKWAKQGVLLLNTVLSVRQGEANSHQGQGWEIFTDEVIKTLNQRKEPVIFILWGKPSQQKKS